eukprot:5935115-Amphidinium_carterae.2
MEGAPGEHLQLAWVVGSSRNEFLSLDNERLVTDIVSINRHIGEVQEELESLKHLLAEGTQNSKACGLARLSTVVHVQVLPDGRTQRATST